MLLSRVAESVYWAGRYLERAEATARLVKAHSDLFIDLPRATSVGWTPLLAVVGSGAAFAQRHDGRYREREDEVVRSMCADLDNPSSVVAAVIAARDNLRVARALLPRSSWEVLNEMYLRATYQPEHAVRRETRNGWLNEVIHRGQWLAGLLDGTMSHDDVYAFLQIGRMIERADMTTRVIDVHAGIMYSSTTLDAARISDATWSSALRALGAHQMFLRSASVVEGNAAVQFLFRDRCLPRSVEFCLTTLSQSLLELPRYERPMAQCARIQRLLESTSLPTLELTALHDVVDQVQIQFAMLHDELLQTYFKMPSTDPQLSHT